MSDNDDIRSTDNRRDHDIILLKRELDEHKKAFDKHIENDNARWKRILEMHEESLNADAEVRAGQAKIIEQTSDIVDAWQAAEGAVKVARAIGLFVKWLSGFSVIAAIITYVMQHTPK